MEQRIAIGSSMQLGYFWPIQRYKAKFGTEPEKKAVTLHKHNNQWLKGVILGPEHGWSIGCLRLKHIDSVGGRKTT